MSQKPYSSGAKGISLKGLGPEYFDDVKRKSRLLLEGRALAEQGCEDEAVACYAQAAQIETKLADESEKLGLVDNMRVHRFSAASCWARAGNLFDAIAICDSMLNAPDTPDHYREHVQDYLTKLRDRRMRYAAELAEVARREEDAEMAQEYETAASV